MMSRKLNFFFLLSVSLSHTFTRKTFNLNELKTKTHLFIDRTHTKIESPLLWSMHLPRDELQINIVQMFVILYFSAIKILFLRFISNVKCFARKAFLEELEENRLATFHFIVCRRFQSYGKDTNPFFKYIYIFFINLIFIVFVLILIR